MEFGNKLAKMLRQGSDTILNLPTEAQRFLTNPQAFTQLITGKNPMPRETGFAAGATGLPPTEMSVLDPNQAPYMQGYTQGEPIGYAGMAAPFAAPAAVATAKALAPKLGQVTENYMVKQGMIQPLTAYHGTPHLIKDKFDISKVGTGEGAQAYGHGMYFAESPSVANAYKGTDEVRILANGQVTESPVAKQIVRYGGDSQAFINSLENKLNNQKQALQKASKEEVLPDISNYDIAKMDLDATLKMIDEAKSYKSVKTEPVGNLYKVDIPDEYIPKMLDYEKPIKDQPELYELIKNNIQDPALKNSFIYNASKGISGSNAYMNYLGGKSNKERSANALTLGIKGIRYLDEGSRNKGGGTSNYVVFDPTDVKILERNNQPISRKELLQEQIDKIAQ